MEAFNHVVASSDYSNTLSTTKLDFSAEIIGDENKRVMQAIDALKTKPSLTAQKSTLLEDASLEEHLFDARAKVKILTSAVSMHIKPEMRKKLFHQIDMLHEPDEWESNDVPVNQSSFKAFLSGLLQINPDRGPGLGLSMAGNMITSWVSDKDRLIIEFMPDNVKWVITRFVDNEPEHFTGYTKIFRLIDSLAPFNPEQWFWKREEVNELT